MLAPVVTAVVFVGVLAVAWLARANRRAVRAAEDAELARRLGRRGSGGTTTLLRDTDDLGALAWLGRPVRWLDDLRRRAGSTRSLGSTVGIIVAWSLLGAALIGLFQPGPMALLGLLVGLAPLWLLRRRAQRRSLMITRQLPEALDLIVRALRSGHGFAEALRLAAEQLPPPMADLLGPAAEEHRLGLDLRSVLDGIVLQIPESFELRLFASSVLLHRETGGNLIEILEQLSDTVRERLVFEHKVRALTAEVRASARILEALPVLAALALLVVAPDYLVPLVEPGLGRTMLLGAMASMTVGMLVMRRIAQVEP